MIIDKRNNPSVTFGDSSLYTREPEMYSFSSRSRAFFDSLSKIKIP